MTSPRRLRPDEARLWALVASTVPGARLPLALEDAEPAPPAPLPQPPSQAAPVRPRASPEALARLLAEGVSASAAGRARSAAAGAGPLAPAPIEPNRKRRIVRAREPIGGRLDLHGHDHDRARAALHAFIAHAHGDGARAVLVITGKGRGGEGLLRRLTPEWLTEPPSRGRVAGMSVAEARHGGEGALYVALKRRV